MNKASFAFILFSAVCLTLPLFAYAQSVNYIDESGTIHFADSIHQVPLKYRSQLIKPTPGPRTDDEYRRQMTEYKRQQAEEERAQREAQRAAEKERQKKEREQQKLSKLKKKELEAELRRRERDQERLEQEARRSSSDQEPSN